MIKPIAKGEGSISSDHKGFIDIFDMKKIDHGLGEDLKTKLETIASSYKFRKAGSSIEPSQADITVAEEMCEHNSKIALNFGL